MSLLDAAGVVTGDIWCSGAFSFESPLKDLIDSGEYTLEQLLAEDELLQELRGVHPELIRFFSTEEAVTGLIQYVTLPPNGTPPAGATSAFKSTNNSLVSAPLDDDDDDEETGENGENTNGDAAEDAKVENGTEQENANSDEPQTEREQVDEEEQADEQDEKDTIYVRFPYMSCEVICCEIKGIVDKLVDGFVPEEKDENSQEGEDSAENKTPQEIDENRRAIIDLLFAMLYDAEAGEIDDYRAGYFDKILSVLFRKRPQSLADYINEGGGRGNVTLMKAMFKHLYSHSIMQIVQRLLLPQPPLPPKEEGEEEKEGDDLYSDPLDAGDFDGFGLFRCNWSESEVALELLLDCLIQNSKQSDVEQEEEMRLSLYQNASEVLITIIQNSPLTSPTLHTLTTNPVLEKLIKAATCLQTGESFSPHDSQLTCTMNVLESLILQLGGYGSVGTMIYPDDEEMGMEGENGEEGQPNMGRPLGSMRQELVTSDTLISHLPMMLGNLSNLLTYQEADSWTSPMQFSKEDPQKILGSSRLRIVRLLESLVLLGDQNVDSELCKSDCLEVCLDLFWKFQWCSMLHQSVANLLVHVFEGANSRAELQAYFLVKCNLLGRLMDSFWDGVESMPDVDGEVEQNDDNEDEQKNDNNDDDNSKEGATTSTVEDETDAPATDPSRQIESHENDALPPQSFRLGYMGHVIIICQALVHACSNEVIDPSIGGTNSEMNGEPGEFAPGSDDDEVPERNQNVTDEGSETDGPPQNPLILAHLVDTHPLHEQWDDFVQSTLASETAIQSTPLGGFPGASPGMDPLHAHRPGLAEDDDYDDDDGAAPPLPPRGLLVGGDVIDMDDNDLDVAASMMAGLSIGRGSGGPPSEQDLLAGIPQQTGDTAQSSGYLFDDPLGHGRFGDFDDDDDDSSSDEESEVSGNTGDSGGAVAEGVAGSAEISGDAPVMDLFAGNFDAFGEKQDAGQQGADWSDFANFDSAFDEGPTSDDPFKAETNGDIDDIFGDAKDHSELLVEEPDPASDAFEAKVDENPETTVPEAEEIQAAS